MYNAIVFFDLDGTLLLDNKQIAPSTIAAIDELRHNHILPVIATGRNLFEIAYVLDQTKIDSVVSANGSYVTFQGQKLHADIIPADIITNLNTFAVSQNDPVAWFNNRSFALSKETKATDDNFKLLHLQPHVSQNWYQDHPVNFLFVFNADKEQLYQQRFAGQLSFVRNNPRGLDTMVDGVSKKTGIVQLLHHAGLSNIPTYGFGDQLNDLEMFDLVDHPVVMDNGNSEAKKKAEFITKSNMDNGIVYGLKHYHLI